MNTGVGAGLVGSAVGSWASVAGAQEQGQRQREQDGRDK